jgi:hypothetical protein
VDGPCTVSAEGLTAVLLDGEPVRWARTAGGAVEFEARAGSSYRLTFEGQAQED